MARACGRGSVGDRWRRRMVVAAANGTVDVKKERRKKPTLYLCGRVVVNVDGRVGGH